MGVAFFPVIDLNNDDSNGEKIKNPAKAKRNPRIRKADLKKAHRYCSAAGQHRRGPMKTEVQVDENYRRNSRASPINAIHQKRRRTRHHHLHSNRRSTGRTARSTTNRLDEDSLYDAIKSSLQLAHSQPKNSRLAADARQAALIAGVNRFRERNCCNHFPKTARACRQKILRS